MEDQGSGTPQRRQRGRWGARRREQGRRGAPLSPKQQFVAKIERRVRIEAPWSVEEFRSWMARDLTLEVDLQPYSAEHGERASLAGQCGLVVVTPTRARIWYDDRRSPRHQRAQIFHEFAHLLCDHHRSFPLLGMLQDGDHPLAAGLSPELLKAMFGESAEGQSSGRERMEAEAELVGTKLAVQSRGPIEPHRSFAKMLATWEPRA